jgi:hypothetical protein
MRRRHPITIVTRPFPYYYPQFYGPSLPFYWQQPFYPAAQPAPRFICTKEEDEEGEEKFVCEVDPETSFQRQPVLYVRPFVGRWF